MILSEKQKEIVESKYSKVVVISSAAAGKTACISERIKFLLNHGADPTKMLVITYTVSASEELKDRIRHTKGSESVYIGTIHSYAYYLLCLSGHKEEADKCLTNEKFDKLFSLLRKYPHSIQPIDYLILDEAQDCADDEWYFMLDMINPPSYFICGDHKQSIFSFIGADPEYLINLSKKREVQFYALNENYRNGYNILSYAKRIIDELGMDYFDNSICKSGKAGRVEEVEWDFSLIPSYIAGADDYGKWFVLTRTNDEGAQVQEILTRAGIPNDSFKRSGMTGKELSDRMRANTVKVLTMHTAKGLEADYVIAIDPRFYTAEERRLAYVAATRAKEVLYWMVKPKKKRKVHRMTNWE